MTSGRAVAFTRWGIAATGAATVTAAVHTAQTASGFAATADFLSSVTAQTNILSVLAFLVAGAAAWRHGGRTVARDPDALARRDSRRDALARRGSRIAILRAVNVATLVGMSALFLSIYGPVVVGDPSQLNPTSVLLHVVIPVLAVTEWFVFPPGRRAPIRGVLLVLVYPCLWFVFTFVRGAMTGRYVYEFLDPAGPGGQQGVVAMTVLIVSSFFLVGAVVFVTQRSQRRRSPTLR